MKPELSRRDFIKLLSMLPPMLYLKPDLVDALDNKNADNPNIIFLVFDTWSARNISLYGYPRQTTPNLERLANKATVYHNHYAGAHFTTPGTTTLLTGVQPWRHHLYHSGSKFKLDDYYKKHNLFGSFPDYYRFAYTHNPFAEIAIQYMVEVLDRFMPHEELFSSMDIAAKLFPDDYDAASVSWIRSMELLKYGYANSIFSSRIWSYFYRKFEERYKDRFLRGLPSLDRVSFYNLENAIDWLANNVKKMSNPFLAYYHLLPPHDPYNTRNEFVRRFVKDKFKPPDKPEHFMAEYFMSDVVKNGKPKVNQSRREYDEYILYVDAEIGRLFSMLEADGSLENTCIIMTSDHGEMFERGIIGHALPCMYQSLVNVPLLIMPPGQKERIDIYEPTAAIDILPTLLNITGREIPSWMEGELLPPYNSEYPLNRSIYVIDAKYSEADKPYQTASLMLRKENFKLIYHFGVAKPYKPLNGEPYLELYDLENDPEEMDNLFEKRPVIANELFDEMNAKLASMNLLK